MLNLVHVQHLTIVGIKATVTQIIKAAAISDFVLRKYQALSGTFTGRISFYINPVKSVLLMPHTWVEKGRHTEVE